MYVTGPVPAATLRTDYVYEWIVNRRAKAWSGVPTMSEGGEMKDFNEPGDDSTHVVQHKNDR